MTPKLQSKDCVRHPPKPLYSLLFCTVEDWKMTSMVAGG
jgi:hypothetical protein